MEASTSSELLTPQPAAEESRESEQSILEDRENDSQLQENDSYEALDPAAEALKAEQAQPSAEESDALSDGAVTKDATQGELRVDLDAAKKAVCSALAGIDLLKLPPELCKPTTGSSTTSSNVAKEQRKHTIRTAKPVASRDSSTTWQQQPTTNVTREFASQYTMRPQRAPQRPATDNFQANFAARPYQMHGAFAAPFLQDAASMAYSHALPPQFVPVTVQQDYPGFPYVAAPAASGRHPLGYNQVPSLRHNHAMAAAGAGLSYVAADSMVQQLHNRMFVQQQLAAQQLQAQKVAAAAAAAQWSNHIQNALQMQSQQQRQQHNQQALHSLGLLADPAAVMRLANKVPPTEVLDAETAEGAGLLALYESTIRTTVLQAKTGDHTLENRLQGEHTLLLAMLNILLRIAQGSVSELDAVGDFNFVTVTARKHLLENAGTTRSFQVALQAVAHVIYLLCPANKTDVHQAAFRLLDVLAWNSMDLQKLVNQLQLAPSAGSYGANIDLAVKILIDLTQAVSQSKSLLDSPLAMHAQAAATAAEAAERVLGRSLSAPSATMQLQRPTNSWNVLGSSISAWDIPEDSVLVHCNSVPPGMGRLLPTALEQALAQTTGTYTATSQVHELTKGEDIQDILQARTSRASSVDSRASSLAGGGLPLRSASEPEASVHAEAAGLDSDNSLVLTSSASSIATSSPLVSGGGMDQLMLPRPAASAAMSLLSGRSTAARAVNFGPNAAPQTFINNGPMVVNMIQTKGTADLGASSDIFGLDTARQLGGGSTAAGCMSTGFRFGHIFNSACTM